MSIKEKALEYGLSIIYENPIDSFNKKRISEYRPKTKEIVIFHKEFEEQAIAHELFHHLNKDGTEEEAIAFSNKFSL